MRYPAGQSKIIANERLSAARSAGSKNWRRRRNVCKKPDGACMHPFAAATVAVFHRILVRFDVSGEAG